MLLFSSWQAERTFAVTKINVSYADFPDIGYSQSNVCKLVLGTSGGGRNGQHVVHPAGQLFQCGLVQSI